MILNFVNVMGWVGPDDRINYLKLNELRADAQK